MRKPSSPPSHSIDLSTALYATGEVCAELASRTNAIQAAVSIPSLVTSTDSETAKLIQDLDFLAQALQAVQDITSVLAVSAKAGVVAEDALLSAAHLSRLQRVFQSTHYQDEPNPGEIDLF